MTTLPRAATAPELSKIRSDNQSSRLYLTVHKPATIYSARLAALPSSNDKVSSITYNTGSGTHTNILADMTLYVGTSAGAYDLGMVRIRNTTGIGATSGTFNIGMVSEVPWSANCYLTVVDEFALFPRWPITDDSGTVFMDTDVAYTDQHSKCLSFPIFGRYAVKWLTGVTVNVNRDASQSWALNNTINSYAWTAPGASATSGMSTATPTITYNAAAPTAGYRIACTIGNTDGVSFTGYGRVFVLADENDAITQFNLESVSGDYSSGGWSARVTCYAEADTSTIRDRALCIIHRRDWYGLTTAAEGSIGYVADDENIELVGWIAGETIHWLTEAQAGAVEFMIYGPQYWFNKITMPTIGLKNLGNAAPSNWKRFQGLTAKSASWHLLMWRTTAPRMLDCFSIENGWAALQLQSGGAQTVWQQLSNILDNFLLAAPCCDAYGRLFMQIEQQCLSSAARSSIPTVLTITGDDWENEITFDRREVNEIGGVDLTGEIYSGTNTSLAVYALAPGRVFLEQGTSIYSRTRLVVSQQSDLNSLAASLIGWKTNPYPNWKFVLPSNLHLIDLAPYQYLEIDIAAGDTPRGIVKTNLRLIPRQINRTFSAGIVKTEITTEAEAAIGIGITGDTPADAPAIPVTPPPPPYVPPTPQPVPSGNAKEVWFMANGYMYWAGDFFSTLDSQPTWNKVAGPGVSVSWWGITPAGIAYAGNNDNTFMASSPKTGVWTTILSVGDSAGSYHLVYRPFGWLIGPWQISLNGNTLHVAASIDYPGYGVAQGEHNGTAWAWSGPVTFGGFSPASVGPQSCVLDNRLFSFNWTLLEDLNASNVIYGLVHRTSGGTRIYPLGAASQGLLHVREPNSTIYTLDAYSNNSDITNTHLTGSVLGAQIYVVVESSGNPKDGHLFISDDGSTFVDTATWDRGWAYDAGRNGGGSLVWTLASVAQSNVPIRLYERTGTGHDKTGNFWSLTSGSQAIVGAGLVY